MEASDYCIITTTTDSKENADAITQRLLEKKLVACVQSTTIQSAYHWERKIQAEIEHLHTYDVPEIIMVPMAGANPAYLQWIEEETIST